MIIATVTITRELDDETGEMFDSVEAVDSEGDGLDLMVAAGMCSLGQHKMLAQYVAEQDDE